MKRENLIQAIEYILPGIDKPGSPLGMDFLIFDKGYLRSFNDTISVSFFTDIPDQFQCAIKAQEFYKILTKMEGDQIRLSLTTTELTVKNPKTTLKMTLMEGKQFNVIMGRLISLDTKKLKWEILPSDFMEGLMLCAPNVKNDLTLGSLAGLAVINQQDKMLLIATDNQRISVYTSKNPLSEGFILPAEVIGDVIKYGQEIASIAITDNWIHFGDQKGLILSTRKLMGEYPVVKVTDVLKNNNPDRSERPYQLPEGLEQALNRAEILSQLDMAIPTISLERKGGFLIVRGERDAGQIEDKVVWEKEGMPENLIIIISPEFLRRVLKITREFKITPNKNAAMFEGKNFQHLMVITVKETKK